jgi:peroxiredoxin
VYAYDESHKFTLKDINGEDVSFSEYEDKIIILNFFATWCVPCNDQTNELRKVWESSFSEDIVIISVSTSPDFDTDILLKEFIEHSDIVWRVVRDTEGLATQYRVSIVPTIVIIDSDGALLYKYVGLSTADSIIWIVNNLLETAIKENGFSSILTTSRFKGLEFYIPWWFNYLSIIVIMILISGIITFVWITEKVSHHRKRTDYPSS